MLVSVHVTTACESVCLLFYADREPPVSEEVVEEVFADDPEAALRWHTTLAGDVVAQEIRPARDAELEGGDAYAAVRAGALQGRNSMAALLGGSGGP